MLKPLFARISRLRSLQSLEPADEPLLFALVRRIARAVDAPEPERIELDWQVNASASSRAVSLQFYGQVFGNRAKKDCLMPVKTLLTTLSEVSPPV